MYEGLLSIFEKYGFYQEALQSITLKGKDGAEQIAKLMEAFREEPLVEIAGVKVTAVEDYLTSVRVVNGQEETIDFPRSNVLKYHLIDGSWVALRPSGTEPKAKFYFGVKGESMAESRDKLETVQDYLMGKVTETLEL